MNDDATILHATLIAARRGGRWRGVLLTGPSGSGKSGLAVRAIAAGWRLVADDRVWLWSSGGELYGSAPGTLQGLIEVRGLGVMPQAALRFCPIDLAVRACPPDQFERIPDSVCVDLLGASRPQIALVLHDPRAVETLGRALDAALRGAL